MEILEPPVNEIWALIPEEKRAELIGVITEGISPATFVLVKEAIEKDPEAWMVDYHHGWGTDVRNILRSVMRDDEIPYPEGYPEDAYRGWDDLYAKVVEEAVKS